MDNIGVYIYVSWGEKLLELLLQLRKRWQNLSLSEILSRLQYGL